MSNAEVSASWEEQPVLLTRSGRSEWDLDEREELRRLRSATTSSARVAALFAALDPLTPTLVLWQRTGSNLRIHTAMGLRFEVAKRILLPTELPSSLTSLLGTCGQASVGKVHDGDRLVLAALGKAGARLSSAILGCHGRGFEFRCGPASPPSKNTSLRGLVSALDLAPEHERWFRTAVAALSDRS